MGKSKFPLCFRVTFFFSDSIEEKHSLYEITTCIFHFIIYRTAYTKLRDGDIEASIKLFQYNIDHFPESANAYDSMGEAYEKLEKWEKAKSYYEKAIEIARKKEEEFEVYLKNLERVKKNLGG